jgi:hypothetical protein
MKAFGTTSQLTKKGVIIGTVINGKEEGRKKLELIGVASLLELRMQCHIIKHMHLEPQALNEGFLIHEDLVPLVRMLIVHGAAATLFLPSFD